ncbi:MAG: glucosamine inositolphosphorylceramide transferase family protein [Edaphobacter sp.]
MLRIGIMLDSYVSSAWVAKIIEDIQASGFARIELVVLNTPPPAVRPPLGKRLRNHWKLTLFHRYEQWDYKRNKATPDAKASTDLSPLLADVPCITVHPLRKGFTDRIPDDELEAIRSHRLDVLFRFGFRIIRGGILGAAQYGVWSFHHDDNLEYRGGPPLFWEIYEQNPVSGTILQILTDSLDGGRVIYRGHSSTDKSSLYRNRNPIYWKTAEYALRRLRNLNERGMEFIESLPTYREEIPYTHGIYRTPNALKMGGFVARLFSGSLRARVSARLDGSHPQWFLAIRRRTASHSFDDATGYKLMVPPNDRFYADPFLFKKNGRTFLFFEDLRYSEGRALISCCELSPDGTPGPVIEVLRRPYHLSYPFLFEENGETYMIPETKGNRTVELYRATSFPAGWVLETILLSDIYAVDATIQKIGGKYWMFVGLSNGRYSNCDELGIFFSDALKGPWMAHPANPVLSDVRSARPAGALFYDQGRLIRPSQDCARAYGYATVFSEVLTLTETEYEERPVTRLDPGWVKGNLGTHTYTRTDEFEVIDGNFAAKISVVPSGNVHAE